MQNKSQPPVIHKKSMLLKNHKEIQKNQQQVNFIADYSMPFAKKLQI